MYFSECDSSWMWVSVWGGKGRIEACDKNRTSGLYDWRMANYPLVRRVWVLPVGSVYRCGKLTLLSVPGCVRLKVGLAKVESSSC